MIPTRQFRDPAGKFIDRSAMMGAWLPTMCSWAWYGAVDLALESLARFCEHRAGEEYGILGKHLSTDGFECGKLNTAAFLREAEQWLARRDVLLRAREEIRKI